MSYICQKNSVRLIVKPARTSGCQSVSRAYPPCGRRCFLEEADLTANDFSLTLDGSDDVVVVDLSLTWNKHFAGKAEKQGRVELFRWTSSNGMLLIQKY